MKDIDIKDIQHLAQLSSLTFTQEEMENFVPEFNNILNMINQINQAENNEEYVFTNAVDIQDLREDIVGESISQEKALQNAPKQRKGCFNVPRVVE